MKKYTFAPEIPKDKYGKPIYNDYNYQSKSFASYTIPNSYANNLRIPQKYK